MDRPAHITVTLPISEVGAQMILSALVLALATAVAYLMISETGGATRQTRGATGWLKAVGFVFVPIWTLLLVGTLWHLWRLFSGESLALTGPAGLGSGALIAALLGAPFVIWATVIKHRTVEFQKEGHITDRIHKAVEMLGADKVERRDGQERTVPNIEVRIGALLSLERIAQDSTAYDRGRDHVRVMEILCAYIRQNAPATEARDFPLPDWEPLAENADAAARAEQAAWRAVRFGGIGGWGKAREWARSLPPPRADIQLALTILGRRSPAQRQVEAHWGPQAQPAAEWVFDTPCPEPPEPAGGGPTDAAARMDWRERLNAWRGVIDSYRGYRPDLRGSNLQGADLSGLVLSGARLQGARLEGAQLWDARLEGAELNAARLEGAHLFEARLWGANLFEARLEGAFLLSARLGGADLDWARLEGATLYEARLEGADLRHARLEGAELVTARLDEADLRRARLEGAMLRGARLEGANLSGATLDARTDLTGASLAGAAACDADWRAARPTQAQIDVIFADATLLIPDGLTRPAHWPKRALTWGEFGQEWRRWQADPEGYRPPPKP